MCTVVRRINLEEMFLYNTFKTYNPFQITKRFILLHVLEMCLHYNTNDSCKINILHGYMPLNNTDKRVISKLHGKNMLN